MKMVRILTGVGYTGDVDPTHNIAPLIYDIVLDNIS